MHVMGPFLGQGGSAALEDAVVLARCLGRQYCLEMKREWIEAAYIGSIREGEEAKAAAFVYYNFYYWFLDGVFGVGEDLVRCRFDYLLS